MSVDPLAVAREIVQADEDAKPEDILVANIVQKHHQKKPTSTSERVFVASTHSLNLFHPSEAKNKQTFRNNMRSFYWVGIKSIVLEGNSVKMEFVNNRNNVKCYNKGSNDFRTLCYIESPTIQSDTVRMVRHLMRILPVHYTKALGLSNIAKADISPVPLSCVERTRNFAYANSVAVDPAIFDRLLRIVKFRHRKAVIPSCANILTQAALVAGLQVSSIVEEIVFEADEQKVDPWDTLNIIPRRYLPFKYVTVERSVKPDSKLFMTLACLAIPNNPSTVSGFNIRGAKMNKESLASLGTYLRKLHGKLDSLNFASPIADPSDFDSFVNIFANNDEHKLGLGLRFFGIEGVPEEECVLSKFFQHIPNVCSLNFSNNKREIGDLLKDICDSGLSKLEAINLSGNVGTKNVVPTGSMVPSTIRRVDISNSKFDDGALVSFLKFLLRNKFPKGLQLYCRNIEASANEFNNVINYLSSLRTSQLITLDWSGNLVTNGFIQFLRNSKQLRTLYLDSCLQYEDDDTITKLAEALPHLKRLEKFSICGSEGKKLGIGLLSIIDGLRKLPRLSYVNISDNGGGAEAVSRIGQLIAVNRAVKMVVFDGSGEQCNEDVLRGVKDSAYSRGAEHPVVISYPVKDATGREEGFDQLIPELNVVAGADNILLEGDEFTHPFDVYAHQTEFDTDFPLFYGSKYKNEIENLEEMAPDVEERKPSPPKKEEDTDIFEYEDDQSRIRKQKERLAFYLQDQSEFTQQGDGAYDEDVNGPRLTPKIADDGPVHIDWEAFEEKFLVEFDPEPVISKLERKFALPVLREQIQ